MNEKSINKENSTEELIEVGSEITGGIAGTVIGLITAGPAGAIFGSASGPIITRTFKKITSEIKERFLSHREEVRIGATITYAIQKIKEKTENGEQIRNDGFFSSITNDRPASEEILEGILLTSQKEHQEKKLKYYGNLIANLGFDTNFNREQANHLIKVSEQLTFRQLCIIAVFAHKERYELRKKDYMNLKTSDSNLLILLQEIFELYRGSMLISEGAMLGFTYINPSKMKVICEGAYLYNLMELWSIEKSELSKIASILK